VFKGLKLLKTPGMGV